MDKKWKIIKPVLYCLLGIFSSITLCYFIGLRASVILYFLYMPVIVISSPAIVMIFMFWKAKRSFAVGLLLGLVLFFLIPYLFAWQGMPNYRVKAVPLKWKTCSVDSDCGSIDVPCRGWEIMNKKYFGYFKIYIGPQICSAARLPGPKPVTACINKTCVAKTIK